MVEDTSWLEWGPDKVRNILQSHGLHDEQLSNAVFRALAFEGSQVAVAIYTDEEATEIKGVEVVDRRGASTHEGAREQNSLRELAKAVESTISKLQAVSDLRARMLDQRSDDAFDSAKGSLAMLLPALEDVVEEMGAPSKRNAGGRLPA